MGALSPAITGFQAFSAAARDGEMPQGVAMSGGVGDGVAPAGGNPTTGAATLDQVDQILTATHLAAARCTDDLLHAERTAAASR